MKLSKLVWAVLAVGVIATSAAAQDTVKPSRPEQAGAQRIDRPGDRRPERPERRDRSDRPERRDHSDRPERRDPRERPEHPGRMSEKPARPEVAGRR